MSEREKVFNELLKTFMSNLKDPYLQGKKEFDQQKRYFTALWKNATREDLEANTDQQASNELTSKALSDRKWGRRPSVHEIAMHLMAADGANPDGIGNEPGLFYREATHIYDHGTAFEAAAKGNGAVGRVDNVDKEVRDG